MNTGIACVMIGVLISAYRMKRPAMAVLVALAALVFAGWMGYQTYQVFTKTVTSTPVIYQILTEIWMYLVVVLASVFVLVKPKK